MQPQREAMTDCLADVIHVLHIGRRTGTLAVSRSEGRVLEEGYITFVEGRVIEAKVGQQSGLAAFNYLNSWLACSFSFNPHASNGNTAPLHPPLQKNSGNLADSHPTSAVPYSTSITGRNSDSLISSNHAVQRPANPFRLLAGEEILQHPESTLISRTSRRLLLLINGQRGIQELARLMARSPEQVQVLLDELERAGLIQQ